MKRYILILAILFSACAGSIPYHVYTPGTFPGDPCLITPQSPIYILLVDGMSIFQIKKQYRLNRNGNCSQKHGFYLSPGEHTITIDGVPGPDNSKLSGTHTFKFTFVSGEKYSIGYKRLRKLTRKGKEFGIVLINLSSGEIAASIE